MFIQPKLTHLTMVTKVYIHLIHVHRVHPFLVRELIKLHKLSKVLLGIGGMKLLILHLRVTRMVPQEQLWLV